jgi:hypothetical protein
MFGVRSLATRGKFAWVIAGAASEGISVRPPEATLNVIGFVRVNVAAKAPGDGVTVIPEIVKLFHVVAPKGEAEPDWVTDGAYVIAAAMESCSATTRLAGTTMSGNVTG